MTKIWTPEHVRLRLREAMGTLSRLPLTGRDRPALIRVYRIQTVTPWSEAWANALEEIARHGHQLAPKVPRGPPSPGAITRMDECLEWMWWLDERERLIVTCKAWRPRSTDAVARRLGIAPKTVKNLYREAVLTIAANLNEGTPMVRGQ